MEERTSVVVVVVVEDFLLLPMDDLEFWLWRRSSIAVVRDALIVLIVWSCSSLFCFSKLIPPLVSIFKIIKFCIELSIQIITPMYNKDYGHVLFLVNVVIIVIVIR